MRLALIPPISLLGLRGYETDMQLMLPQLVRNADYVEHYRRLCNDPEQFVILDNGAAEGYMCTDDELSSLAYEFQPQEVVIPDIMGDMTSTIEKAKDFEQHVLKDPVLFAGNFNFMFVAQGQTYGEFLSSALWAQQQGWISTIAIPRHAITTLDDELARSIILESFVDALEGSSPKPIHFLGMNSEAPTEIANLSLFAREYVRSVDTSLPFVAGYHDLRIENAFHVKRPEGYFDLPINEFPFHPTERNINKMIEWTVR